MLFTQTAKSDIPQPAENTLPGLPLAGPHSQSWQWKKKEGVCTCARACVYMCCLLLDTRRNQNHARTDSMLNQSWCHGHIAGEITQLYNQEYKKERKRRKLQTALVKNSLKQKTKKIPTRRKKKNRKHGRYVLHIPTNRARRHASYVWFAVPVLCMGL